MKRLLKFGGVAVLGMMLTLLSPLAAMATHDFGHGVVLGVTMEVSKTGTGDWVNYQTDGVGTDAALTANPGDTLYFRETIWNAGRRDAHPTMLTTINNASDFDSITAYAGANADVDNNGVSFVAIGSPTYPSNVYTLQAKLDGDLEQQGEDKLPTEQAIIVAKLANSIPDQTVINGNFSVESVRQETLGLISVAHADNNDPSDGTTSSSTRILISNPAPVVAATTPTAATPALPVTGTTGASQIWVLLLLATLPVGTYLIMKRIQKKTN